MRVAVIGTGHVGLITCVSVAEIGHQVVGTDADPEKMALLGRGIPPFHEPDLVVGCDPQASASAKEDLPELDIAPDAHEAAAGAHCLVVCTEWAEFRILDIDRLRGAMSFPLVVDGRNTFDAASLVAAGFSYLPTGQPPTLRPSTVDGAAVS